MALAPAAEPSTPSSRARSAGAFDRLRFRLSVNGVSPWNDCTTLPLAETNSRRSGARRAPAPAGAGMNQLLRLMSYGRKYWPQILISVVLMALAGAAQGTMPLLIQPVFDRVLIPNAPDGP